MFSSSKPLRFTFQPVLHDASITKTITCTTLSSELSRDYSVSAAL
jgi:hypothetical protein